MINPERKYDDNNVYSKNVKGEIIHISEAESGRKGYYCLGCDKELEGVKSKLQNRISYFRHVPRDVTIERKCTFSDETHRHKIAKFYLLEQKRIKVPALYKFAPKKSDALAMFIKDAEIIEAADVKLELTFYEDEDGTIKWGPNKDVDEKYLYIRPDVTFFDLEGKPILFIELEATNGISFEKQAKLRRLGINTVRVKIPKDSPGAIEESLKNTNKTLWIFNHEQERVEYVYIPKGDTEGISQIDEQQRFLFEESFKCRQTEINNLIRTIKRCLESQPYRTIELGLREELSRVKGNTKEHKSKLDGLRDEHGDAVTKRLTERRTEIEGQRASIESEEIEFGKTEADLVSRYQKKDEKLRIELYEIGRKQKTVERELNGEGEDEDGIGNSNSGTKTNLEHLINYESSEIGRIEQELEAAPGGYKADEDKLIERFNCSTEFEKREIERIELEFSALPKNHNSEEESLSRWIKSEEESLSRNFQSQEEWLPGEFKSKEDELEREFEELRKQSHQTALSRDGVGNTDIAARIRKLLEARGNLNDIEQVQKLFRRYKKAWECFKDGSYESWNK
jgi:hypothetical protein